MTEPRPCPRCGRIPKVREVGFVRGGFSDSSKFIFKAECRKWLGLRRCFGPHEPNWIDKDWADIGRRVAVERWNDAVARIAIPAH